MNTKIKEIEELIIDNKLNEAANQLKLIFESNDNEELLNETILSLSRLNNLLRKSNQGIVNYFDPEFSKVRLSLINLKSSAKKVLEIKNKKDKKITPHHKAKSVVLLEENFENNDSNWDVGVFAASSSLIQNGRLFFEHFGNKNSRGSLIEVKIKSNKNFTIKSRITFLDGNESSGFGIVWGCAQGGKPNNFQFKISANGLFLVNYFLDGKQFNLSEWTENSVIRRGKKMNFLEVIKNGDIMHYKVNGEVVYTSEYISFFGNHVGIVVHNNMKVAVDYFQILN